MATPLKKKLISRTNSLILDALSKPHSLYQEIKLKFTERASASRCANYDITFRFSPLHLKSETQAKNTPLFDQDKKLSLA